MVVENTASAHHVIVCTLCSCYPSSLLGMAPAWYKSRAYRARTIREPRAVLAEFGLKLPREQRIVVHDSTADCRLVTRASKEPSRSLKLCRRPLLVEGMAFWLKAATTAFTFKNLLRHYSKQVLTDPW